MLTKIHKITINSGLVLRIQDQWPDWARLQTSCSAPFSSSGCFIFTIIFCMMAMVSLKVVCHQDSSTDSRQETGLGKYLPTDCAMCNVNNVLQPGHWTADKCSHLGMLSGDCCCLLSPVWTPHNLSWTVRWLSV